MAGKNMHLGKEERSLIRAEQREKNARVEAMMEHFEGLDEEGQDQFAERLVARYLATPPSVDEILNFAEHSTDESLNQFLEISAKGHPDNMQNTLMAMIVGGEKADRERARAKKPHKPADSFAGDEQAKRSHASKQQER